MTDQELRGQLVELTNYSAGLAWPLIDDGSDHFINSLVSIIQSRERKAKIVVLEQVRMANMASTEEEMVQDHIAFENIHPFIDGNGRMGRILLNWQRVKADLPILIIRESERQEYYSWFR